MAPTKGTGQKLSDALKELEIPHYYRNKPVLGATKEKSLIRVQTVHMSKGDEAKNSAIVVQSFGDVVMLAKDPRLSYVAATRASEFLLSKYLHARSSGENERIKKRFLS